jgi:hypothetical protein
MRNEIMNTIELGCDSPQDQSNMVAVLEQIIMQLKQQALSADEQVRVEPVPLPAEEADADLFGNIFGREPEPAIE